MASAPGEQQLFQERWQPWKLKQPVDNPQMGWGLCQHTESFLSSVHSLSSPSDKWAPAPGRWTSLWYHTLPCTDHCPLGSAVCKSWPRLGSFPPRREGLPLLPEQPAGLVMKEIPHQYSSYLAAGCWGFKVWPPASPFPKQRRQSYAWIISWQTLALATGI